MPKSIVGILYIFDMITGIISDTFVHIHMHTSIFIRTYMIIYIYVPILLSLYIYAYIYMYICTYRSIRTLRDLYVVRHPDLRMGLPCSCSPTYGRP